MMVAGGTVCRKQSSLEVFCTDFCPQLASWWGFPCDGELRDPEIGGSEREQLHVYHRRAGEMRG